MIPRIVAVLLLLSLSSVLWAAKPKKRAKKPAARKAVAEKVEAKPTPPEKEDDTDAEESEEQAESAQSAKADEPAASGDEMEAYRQVQNRQIVTVQDLADLLLMNQG